MSKKEFLIFTIIFLFCIFTQIIPVIRSGLTSSNGINFWGPNGHDGVWHLSLINHIKNPFNIEMPTFSGERLKNYHPFFDILLSFVSRFFNINSSLLLFQLFPILFSIFILYFSFRIGKLLTRSNYGGFILMVLNTLNNSWGWVVSFIRFRNFNGESLFWAMQTPSTQLNPPFSLSLVIFLFLIYLFLKSKSSLSFLNKLSIYLLFSLLPVIKVYSFIPAFLLFLFFVLKTKKHLFLFLFSTVSGLFLYFWFNSNSGSLLVFKPFWFINSLIESPDRLYLPALASLRYSLSANHNFLFLFLFYLFFSLIFLLGNFAWRILFFVQPFFKPKWLSLSVFISSLFLCLIPLFFIQSGTAWNTIQFLYYALFLLNIPFTIILSTKIKPAFSLIILLTLLIPLSGSLPQYLGNPAPAAIPSGEIKCLQFLSTQATGNVLTLPYDKFLKSTFKSTPIPLYAYETTSYVSAYSFQKVFLEDEMNLNNSGFDWQKRRDASLKFFEQKNIYEDRGFLVNNQISYIYLAGPQKDLLNLDEENMYLTNIFNNSDCRIYQVNR